MATCQATGADPGFQVRGGAHLKNLRRAEGSAKIFGVFRVKNHNFTPKNHIFSNFRGGALCGWYCVYKQIMALNKDSVSKKDECVIGFCDSI